MVMENITQLLFQLIASLVGLIVLLERRSRTGPQINRSKVNGRHRGGGAVAAKITANVWEIVQLLNLVTLLLYNGA